MHSTNGILALIASAAALARGAALMPRQSSTCSNAAPTIDLTSFTWFNSTHNLDCANPNYPAGSEVCFDADSNLCSVASQDCHCVPYCYTGLPTAAYQPLGYGPPDSVSATFEDGRTCSARNPQSYRNREIGEGSYDCGSAAQIVGFQGDSNLDVGGSVTLSYNIVTESCTESGKVPSYVATFPISCSRDAGGNATCMPMELPVTLNLIS